MNPEQLVGILIDNFEKGYVNNPNDRGEETNFGISKSQYPNLDIKNLTRDKAIAIYMTDYWNPASCQKLKPELQYVHLDTAVNCGVETAINILQEACGISPQTGFFGSETLTKSDNVNIERYLFLREIYDTKIVEHRQDQIIFLGGWSNRNLEILKLHDNKQI